jgi:hypothetical protein
MASQQLIGWDLLFKTIEKDVKKLPDILVAVVHLTLIQNAFQNIGIGDDVCVITPHHLILIILISFSFNSELYHQTT